MKTRARMSILSRLLAYPTISDRRWVADKRTPLVGSLVSMSSAPESKWYLSWLVSAENINDWMHYELESIEDGEICRWHNVSINVYDPEIVASNPEWRWTDKQFTLRDRWRKVLNNEDAYLVLGGAFEFKEDGSLYISLRIRFNFDEKFKFNRTFPNWKKVTIKMMTEFYQEGEAEYKKR